MIHRKTASNKEPTIALLNIVFLMLIFFMIAGTLAPPIDGDLSLIETEGLEGREPPDTLVIHKDGRLSLRGKPLDSAATFLTARAETDAQKVVRIVPDRALPAVDLVRIGAELRRAGATRVMIVSERALP